MQLKLFVLRHPEDHYAPERTDRMLIAMFPNDPQQRRRRTSLLLTLLLILAFAIVLEWAFGTPCRLPFRGCEAPQEAVQGHPGSGMTLRPRVRPVVVHT